MTSVPFVLVRSNGKKFGDTNFLTPKKAETTILDAFTDPRSRSNLMVGDHLYAIPTEKFAEGLPCMELQSRATHVFRITPREVICENHGERVTAKRPRI
ncbi:MAG: hypothetical protein WCT27_03425 [Patescibacteria group bacterium]